MKRIVRRNKIVRTIGLDTGPFVDMILKDPRCYIHDARILQRGGLFVNYHIIREAWGVLVHKKNIEKIRASRIIDEFIERNNIRVIKSSDVEQGKVNVYFDSLKKQENIYKNFEIAGNKDSDLRIISIYKAAGVDCIFTRNSSDFQRACLYVRIEVERQLTNTQMMLRKLRRRNY